MSLLAPPDQLLAEVVADLPYGVRELRVPGRHFGGAGGQQQHGVVGGHAAVGVDPVEGDLGGGPQRPVQYVAPDGRVRGEDDQHGGEAGGEHARALGHAADGPAVLGHDGRLVDGVGGLDRDGGLLTAVLGELGGGGLDSREQLVHREQHADESGGADGDLDRGAAEDLGGLLGGRVRVLEALGARTGVGATGVEDDRGDLAALEDLLGPQDRRGLHTVGGEDAGGGAAGPGVDHEGQVRVAALLDPGGDARGRESLCCRHAHGATPIVVSPVDSSSPMARFMLWTAPPAVPLVRLSMALIAMMRPAASSYATCT